MTAITARDAPDTRAFLDDLDVSDICTAADPDEGWVDLLPGGKAVPDAEGNVITERKYGDVRVELHVRFQTDETIRYCGPAPTKRSRSDSIFVKL